MPIADHPIMKFIRRDVAQGEKLRRFMYDAPSGSSEQFTFRDENGKLRNIVLRKGGQRLGRLEPT